MSIKKMHIFTGFEHDHGMSPEDQVHSNHWDERHDDQTDLSWLVTQYPEWRVGVVEPTEMPQFNPFEVQAEQPGVTMQHGAAAVAQQVDISVKDTPNPQIPLQRQPESEAPIAIQPESKVTMDYESIK